MRQLFITSILFAMITIHSATAQNQPLEFAAIKSFEHQLDDVMELTDSNLIKVKLAEVESKHQQHPNEINAVRLGIIYHETALNFAFLAKTAYRGYAQKSFDVLSELFNSPATTKELLPFIAGYRASALSLVGAETKKLKLLNQAFALFNEAVSKYASVSYVPEFLRGSVAENLPWFFFTKRKFAKLDFQSIIDRYEQNKDYANPKIMSFTYWAWANQRQGKKYKPQSLTYLDRAIAIDPNYTGGRAKAEQLKAALSK